MRCSNCGNDNPEQDRFCRTCGSPLENNQNNNTNMNMNNSTPLNDLYNQGSNGNNIQMNNNPQPMNNNPQPMNNYQQQVNQQPMNNKKDNSKTLGIISLILGLLCIPLAFLLSIFMIPIAIIGIILGAIAHKRGTAIAGIILNVLSIIICIAILVFAVFLVLDTAGEVAGTYKCSDYFDSYASEDAKNKEGYMEFKLNYDGTFSMDYDIDGTNNIIKGEYKVSDMEDEDDDSFKYYALELNANYREIKGEVNTDAYKTKYVLGKVKGQSKSYVLMNTISYSQYTCIKQ